MALRRHETSGPSWSSAAALESRLRRRTAVVAWRPRLMTERSGAETWRCTTSCGSSNTTGAAAERDTKERRRKPA